MRSHRSGADGVVGIAEVLRHAFFRRGSIIDHSVRSVKGGFAAFFLMSRPPLLYQALLAKLDRSGAKSEWIS